MTAKGGYRSDIDGLRAVAVLLVVLFHFDIADALGAGFVGVDVFFVISGFLIVPTIRRQLAERSFRFRSFYARRVRRLAPALIATLLLTLAVGLVILTPSALIALAKESIAAQLYASNIYYWRYLNYFGLQADLSFLLHTWSLGVEEQFYLAFPPLLWLCAKLAPRRLTAALIAVLILSFILNIACVRWKPEATFYLLPTRAWEFAAGALTPVLARRVDRWGVRRGWLAGGGVGLLALACALYQPTMPFPGWFAVLPVAATCALLIAGEEAHGWWGRAMSLPVPVYIGRISYELYLVHWPIRVFAPMLVLDYSLGVRWAAVGLCVALAAGIYHVIEQPIRTRRLLARDRPLVIAYGAATAASLILLAAIATSGWPSRFSAAALAIAHAADDADPRFRGCEGRVQAPCGLGDPGAPATWLIYGDSHADALAGAFDRYLRAHHAAGVFTFASGCPPVLDSGDRNCRAFNRQLLAFAGSHPALRQTVLVSTWRQPLERGYTDAAGRVVRGQQALQAFRASLDRTIATLTSGQRRLAIWLPVPGARRSVPDTLARNVQFGWNWDIRFGRAQYERQFAFLTEALARHPEVTPIRPAPYICAQGLCQVTRNGRPLYHDEAHPAASQEPFFAGVIARELAVGRPHCRSRDDAADDRDQAPPAFAGRGHPSRLHPASRTPARSAPRDSRRPNRMNGCSTSRTEANTTSGNRSSDGAPAA